jgi:hypothetical protein
VFFETLLVSFEIAIEFILVTEIPIASEVIDPCIGGYSAFGKDLIDFFFLTPQNVPIVCISFLPLPLTHPCIDTVPEISLELDI